MSQGILVEVCIDSVESAHAAVRGGADRLELCGNLAVAGGTTPSVGLFKAVKRAVPGIPIAVMIRPRVGDFLYSPLEVDVMLEDICSFKELGAEAVVLGALDMQGQVDVDITSQLVNEALPMQVCFHRAFDMTCDPIEALARISQIPGITHILTSGHELTAVSPTSLSTLRDLLNAVRTSANPNLGILPGSGINPRTVRPLLERLLPHGLRQIHLSAGGWIESDMVYRREGLGMGMQGEKEWWVWRTSEDVVRAVRQAVDDAWAKREVVAS